MGATFLHIDTARTLRARLGGLLVRPPLAAGEALLLTPCSSVHTCFMRYAIDVAFLARDGRVLKLVTLNPWRVAGCLGARSTLELRAGETERLGLARGRRVDLRTGAVS